LFLLKGIDKTSKLNAYICKKFGNDCELALAIVHAENGSMECDRVSKQNKNGTIDRGLWQLNSDYHPFIKDCYKNTDHAYEIYKSRKNFSAWSAYNSKAYQKYLTKN
jgi:hypothetical protein